MRRCVELWSKCVRVCEMVAWCGGVVCVGRGTGVVLGGVGVGGGGVEVERRGGTGGCWKWCVCVWNVWVWCG